jgi:hypothetical protein
MCSPPTGARPTFHRLAWLLEPHVRAHPSRPANRPAVPRRLACSLRSPVADRYPHRSRAAAFPKCPGGGQISLECAHAEQLRLDVVEVGGRGNIHRRPRLASSSSAPPNTGLPTALKITSAPRPAVESALSVSPFQLLRSNPAE